MILEPKDLRSAPMTIICEGGYEPLLSKILFRTGVNARTFLDVGANAGFYSLSLSILNPDIKTISFEPNAEVATILAQNIEINKLDKRITIVNSAVGANIEESRPLFIPKITGTGGGSLNNLHPEEGKPVIKNIKVDTLDNSIGSMDPVDVIKVDVEGFEYEVIKGSENLIENWHPIIFVELLRKWMAPFGAHPQDVVKFLTRKGYICFSIGEDKISKIEIIDEATSETNFIFVHLTDQLNLGVLDEYTI
jgi:FkbM family methyltransferase